MHPELAKLNRQLAKKGETVVLRRRVGTGSTFVSVTCRATVRGYQPNELVGGITQQDSEIVMSPTEIVAGGWPGTAGGSAWPLVNDQLVAQGRTRSVQAAAAIMVDDEVVRIEMRVRG